MQWFSDFSDWLTSTDAQPAIFAAIVLAVAIIVSGLLAAWISRGTVKSVLARTERQQKSSAIAALVDAATEASVWNSLTPQEQVLSDRAVGQADTLVRLLPIAGAGTAANWAAHQLAEMKRNSATFGYQLDPAIAEFRERLIEWHDHPRRGRRLFQNDLDRWRFERTGEEQVLTEQQDAWIAEQHHERFAQTGTASGGAATPTPAADAGAPAPAPLAAPIPATDATAPTRTMADATGEATDTASLAAALQSPAPANPGLRPTGPDAD